VRVAFLLALSGAGLGLGAPAFSQAIGTDIMGRPGSWRGTLLEGTDAIIATNTYGEPLFVQSGETVAPIFAPAPMTAERLAGEFKSLCIDSAYDEAKLASAAQASSLALSNRSFDIPALKSGAAYKASVWHAPAVRVQIWSGDTSGLNNRQTLSRWRNGATSSPFKNTRIFAPACNVTVMATSFDGPAPFVAALSKMLGTEPTKSVVKSQWADGHWTIVDGNGQQARVYYNMVDLDKAEKLLHVAIVPAKGK